MIKTEREKLSFKQDDDERLYHVYKKGHDVAFCGHKRLEWAGKRLDDIPPDRRCIVCEELYWGWTP